MNKEVSFPIAMLLKEKGFSEESLHYYRFFYGEIQFRLGSMFSNDPSDDCLPNEKFFLAPTITEVWMWLYKKHGIWISVQPYVDNDWCFAIFKDLRENISLEGYDSPIEAYEAAINHTLKNLL